MSWYNQLFKSQEAARERNRREQRRLDLELNQRHGMKAIARYHVNEVTQEQRLVERELEKIRQGVNKKPIYVDLISHRLRKNENSSRPHILGIISPRNPINKRMIDPSHILDNTVKIHRRVPDENALFHAIVYLQNHPDAISSILDTHVQKNVSDYAPAHNHAHALGGNLGLADDVQQPQTSIYSKTAQSVPNYIRTPINNDLGTRSPNAGVSRFSNFSIKSRPDEGANSNRSTPVQTPTFTPKPESVNGQAAEVSRRTPRKRHPQDLTTLAHLDMQKSRENIKRRLSSDRMLVDQQTVHSEYVRRQSVAESNITAPSDTAPYNPDDVRIRDKRNMAKAQVVPTYDCEFYNPDGTIRKVHQLPPWEKSWEEAQKARYVRPYKNLRDCDKELTLKQIFDKTKN